MAKKSKKEENEESSKTEYGNILKDPTYQEIGLRLVYTIFFFIVFSIVETIIQVAVVFQFIYLFFRQKPHASVRNFTNKTTAYALNILKYVTMDTNQRPFPFSDSPERLEDLD